METVKSVMFASSEVKIRGEYIEVRPYAFRECYILAKLIENANLDFQYEELVERVWEFPLLISASLNRAEKWMNDLDETDKRKIAEAVVDVNQTFFQKCFYDREYRRDFSKYFEAASYLLEGTGIRPYDIFHNFTLDMIMAFYARYQKSCKETERVIREEFDNVVKNILEGKHHEKH